MVIFNRRSLPKVIRYNGYEYTRYEGDGVRDFDELEKNGFRPIRVDVLARNLEGKFDAHGKEYQPTQFFFVISADQIRYRVIKIIRGSGNRITLENNLTKEEAKELVNSYPDSDKHMVCFTKM